MTQSENPHAGSAPVSAELAGREVARIRPYRPGDLDALYRICLLTGNDGQDATPLFRDPMLPGHVYAAPYGVLEPSLAFVAEDAAGVGGYIVGALDSLDFAKRLEAQWWPELRRRYPHPPQEIAGQRWTRDERLANHIHHPWPVSAELAERYPSHLHINLMPRLQARGHGRRLISTLIEALRARGSSGVHLHVSLGNQPAARFYQRIGFTELPATGSRLFGMDLRSVSARPGADGTPR